MVLAVGWGDGAGSGVGRWCWQWGGEMVLAVGWGDGAGSGVGGCWELVSMCMSDINIQGLIRGISPHPEQNLLMHLGG